MISLSSRCLSGPILLGPGALRLALAFIVVASHLSRFEIGRPAVFVFFALSGYWILNSLDEIRRSGIANPLRHFYLSRFLRIWPPFAVAFVIAMAMALSGEGLRPGDGLAGLTLLGVASHGADPLGVSWSLDIELQFYLLAPGLALLVPRAGAGFWLGCAGACLLGWVAQLGLGLWSVLSYLPCFLAGALIWHYRWCPSWRVAAMGAVAFGVIALAVASWPQTRGLLLRDIADPIPSDLFGMLWVLPLMPLLARILARPSGGIDRHLGDLSYPLYLLHWPVIAALRPGFLPLEWLDRAGLALACLAVAGLFYWLVDRPCDRFRRDRFRLSAKADRAGGAAPRTPQEYFWQKERAKSV